MKIVIAPDSYKESLSALGVAIAIEAGFRAVFPDAEYRLFPMADGGEGTVDAMVTATGGTKISVTVSDPLGNPIDAELGLINPHYAVVEMAAASGLERIPVSVRNPLVTSTYGTGELIRAALDRGVTQIILGLGGSATNDGGAGMLQALGYRLLDQYGVDIPRGGVGLAALASIDCAQVDARLSHCQFIVACDVTNPLTGPSGASHVFGPQKGADPAMVALLDDNLKHYARIVAQESGVDVEFAPGAGAAGGTGAALLAFMKAELRSGIDMVTSAVGLEQAIAEADLVITGEGRLDSQSVNGKVPVGIARIAKRYNKPVIAIAGSLGADFSLVYAQGIDSVFSVLNHVCTLEEALTQAAENIRITARNVAATLQIHCR
jgi:glycerate kinase